MTRKYDTLIHSPGCGGGGAARRPTADYSGKQESADDSRIVEVGGPFLFNPLSYYKPTWAWENLTPY